MRFIILVIDSFGIGALPDAAAYGDDGSNTAKHICDVLKGANWPNLKKMGLGNAGQILGVTLKGCEPADAPLASFGVMVEQSPGKDTTTGHWELGGIILEKPFHTYPLTHPSFPLELIDQIQQAIGHKIIGNIGASGTQIIQELGEDHVNGKGIIAYTSADSVFQIAAHEDVVPVNELYHICQKTRKILNNHNVARVIARPFIGTSNNFTRTANRRDFSMDLPEPSILDRLTDRPIQKNIETIGVGKIGDIFNEKGLSQSYHDKGNPACLKRTLDLLKENASFPQLIFINLVDTDMLYGHRRDAKGYHAAVQAIDDTLPLILEQLNKKDVLIVTADHGCDPTFKGTDHTREYVPLLCYQKDSKAQNFGIRNSFADVAQSAATFFKINAMPNGDSFIFS